MSEEKPTGELLQLTATIVSAMLSKTSIEAEALPGLISSVHRALSNLGQAPEPPVKQQPAVSARRSVFPDYIICLEDGKKLKMLKRHLKTSYNLTPEQYRDKWGLPHDYPMVAPNYATHRSDLAKRIGLGRKPDVPVAPAKPVGRRGRRAQDGAAT